MNIGLPDLEKQILLKNGVGRTRKNSEKFYRCVCLECLKTMLVEEKPNDYICFECNKPLLCIGK